MNICMVMLIVFILGIVFISGIRIYYYKKYKRILMARSWLKKHKDDIKKDLEGLR